MTVLAVLDQRVTIQRIGSVSTDDWNNPEPGVVGTDEYDGRLVPVTSREVRTARDTITVDLVLWLEPRAVVAATDRAVVAGEVFEIMAEPTTWRGVLPATSHVEVPVWRVISG